MTIFCWLLIKKEPAFLVNVGYVEAIAKTLNTEP
jgi:hypothetical protein